MWCCSICRIIKNPCKKRSETDLTAILLMQKRRFFIMACLTSYNTDCPIWRFDKKHSYGHWIIIETTIWHLKSIMLGDCCFAHLFSRFWQFPALSLFYPTKFEPKEWWWCQTYILLLFLIFQLYSGSVYSIYCDTVL